MDLSFLSNSIFIGDLIGGTFGMLISLAIAPFLSFWISSVKKRAAVIVGGFAGSIIGLLILLAWAASTIVTNASYKLDAVAVFFGSLFFCTITGVVGGMITDLLVASKNARDYRRQIAHE